MGRKRRNCPVFGCGSTNLVRLANHLDQIHGMDKEERAKWLRWSKMDICIPLQDEETNADVNGLNVEKSLEKLLKRQEEMESTFYNYLREQSGKLTIDYRAASDRHISKKWLHL